MTTQAKRAPKTEIDPAQPEQFINRELSSAGLQHACHGGLQHQPSAARTVALPVDFGEQPGRVLHGPRRGLRGQLYARVDTPSDDGITAAALAARSTRRPAR